MQKNSACILPDQGSGQNCGRAVSLRDALPRIANPDALDATVNEVFRTMLGVTCHRFEEGKTAAGESVTAVVGFGGILSGACVLRLDAKSAMEIASRLTGTPFGEVEDTVKDAVGEMANMLAGAWKSKIPELASHCGLSLPAVITGQNYELRVQAPRFALRRAYRFDEVHFQVTIVCDGLQ